MALGYESSAVATTVTLTAGSADTTYEVDVSSAHEATVHIKLTNASSGPTVAAQVQINTEPGNNSRFYSYGGALLGTTTNNAISSWGGVLIPLGIDRIQIAAGSNTDQDVTLDVDVVKTTGI